jgi:multidrug resistance efflux pump
VDRAALDLTNTLVRASADGLVTDLRTDVGQFAGTGTPVMTLISIRDFWINAEFTENNLGNLRVGSPVEIIFDSLPGRIFPGRVRNIGYGVGTGSSNPPGTLPTISNNRDWLRQAQRFPVVIDIDFDAAGSELTQQLRIGGQASIVAYTGKNGFLNALGKGYIRTMSLLSYAY